MDDFKVVGAKSEEKGKRTYRQGRPAAVAAAAMAAARTDIYFAAVFFISSVGSWIDSVAGVGIFWWQICRVLRFNHLPGNFATYRHAPQLTLAIALPTNTKSNTADHQQLHHRHQHQHDYYCVSTHIDSNRNTTNAMPTPSINTH